MRVAVVFQHRSAGGGARFVVALVRSLAENVPGMEIGLFASSVHLEPDGIAHAVADVPSIRFISIDNAPSQVVRRREEPRRGGPLPANRSGGPASSPRTSPYRRLRRQLKRGPGLRRAYLGLLAARDRLWPAPPRAQPWTDFQLDESTIRALEQYDLVYLSWPYFIEPVELSVPIVIICHDFNYRHPLGTIGPELALQLDRQVSAWIARAAATVVSSRFIADELELFYPGLAQKVEVIRLTHLGITGQSGTETDALLDGLGIAPPFMLCASNTSPHKNIAALLDAVGILGRRGNRVPLVLAGWGTELIGLQSDDESAADDPMAVVHALSRQMRQDGLEVGREVFALGYVSDPAIEALIARARLLVSPSLYEAGCGPALDAWATGTTVAFSDIPPFREHLVELGTEAWLFDPRDPSGMADVLELALAEADTSRGMAARSREAIARRTWADIAREYGRVFDEAVHATRAGTAVAGGPVAGRPRAGTGRIVQPADAAELADLFTSIDPAHFHPHPFTREEADRVARYQGRDVYAALDVDGRFVAYGILRGWDEGFAVPSLGIGVRAECRRRGYGRQMMAWLAEEAVRRGAAHIRLRVHPDNASARRLYESLGYADAGEERGELVMILDLPGAT
jgi:glycosyltransferase involved in cell wall biosynthesis/ribosomal protein S18 acetylase RimI-like enzyme